MVQFFSRIVGFTYIKNTPFLRIRTLTAPTWHSSLENIVSLNILCHNNCLVTNPEAKFTVFEYNRRLIWNLYPVVSAHQLGDRYYVRLFEHVLGEVKFQWRVGVEMIQSCECLVLHFGVSVLQVQLHHAITI